jgi:hypothetical protein
MNERLDRSLAIYAAIVTAVAAAIAASARGDNMDIDYSVLSLEIFVFSLLLSLGGTFLLTFLMACSLAKTEYALGLLFIDKAIKAALDNDKTDLSYIYSPLPFPPLDNYTKLLEKLAIKQSSQDSQASEQEKATNQGIKECLRPMLISSSVRMMRVWNSILFGVATGAAFVFYNSLNNSEPIPLLVITVLPVATICWYVAYFTFPPQIDPPAIAKPWCVPPISIISIVVGLAMIAGFVANSLGFVYLFIFCLLLAVAFWNVVSGTDPAPVTQQLTSGRFWGPPLVGLVCTIIVFISKYLESQVWISTKERFAIDISTLAFLLSMTLFFYFTRNRADQGLSSILGKLDIMFDRNQV